VKIIYVPSGKQIHLNGDLPQDEFDWLESLQGQCHRANPILKCSRCDGALYVRHGKNNADSLLAVHFTQGSCEDIRIIRPGMSPDHRHEAEYYAQAAEQAGYRAQFEVKTVAETRVDVVIEGGPVRAGLEVQRSGLSVGAALERTRRTASVGVTVAWSANVAIHQASAV
jgi:competence CoiA-like predicted nuclease